MSLEQGFLRKPKYQFNRQFIITSLLLVIINAVVFYYLLVFFKETIRILTFSKHDYLLILTARENFFYNWFYANIAINVGLGIGIKFLFESSLKSDNVTLDSRPTGLFITNNQSFHTWNYSYWFAKVFSMFGILAMGMPIMYFSIDFYKELQYFFILLIVVWYFNLWLGFYKLRIKRIFLLPAMVFIVVQLFASLLALNNVIEVDETNERLKTQIISVKYQIDLPQIQAYRNRQIPFKNVDIYVGRKQNKISDRYNIILKGQDSFELSDMEISNLQTYFKEQESEYFIGSFYTFRVTINADRNISYKTIQNIKDIIKKAGISNIFYATLPEKKKVLRKDYAMFGNYGLMENLYPDCSNVIAMVDSLIELNLKFNDIEFPNHHCYRGAFFKNKNRVKVKLDGDQNIYINNKNVTITQLEDYIYHFIKKYHGAGLIFCEFDQEVSYEAYLKFKLALNRPLTAIRNEISKNLFEKNYTSLTSAALDDMEKIEIIQLYYPNNITELTETDKFLYEFSKK